MFTRFKCLIWKATLITTIISLLAFTVALAASGDLDMTFDGDGLVTTNIVPSEPERFERVLDLAIQSDGRIVAVGDSYVPSNDTYDFAIARYNSDGSLDTIFSGDGRLITDFGRNETAYNVAVQPNGKIIVAGDKCHASHTNCDIALARYNPDGMFDTTFSGDGKQITDFGSSDNGSFGGMAIQSNGKIVVAGYTLTNGTDYDFAVYRYLPNGSLDTTFNGDGRVRIGFGAGRQDHATDLVLQGDGKILVAGFTSDPSGLNHNFAIARLNLNGSLDGTFSGNGRQVTNMGADEIVWGIALQLNGKIVVVGERRTLSNVYFAAARYNTNGSLDPNFNGTGKKVLSVVPGTYSWAEDVIIQPNGMIVIVGRSHNGSDQDDFALVRLKPNSAFDTMFGGDGKITVDFGNHAIGSALALHPSDSKYVLGGYAYPATGTSYHFALARVLP